MAKPQNKFYIPAGLIGIEADNVSVSKLANYFCSKIEGCLSI